MKAVVYQRPFQVAVDNVPDCAKFDNREDGWTKVLLHPEGNVVSHGAAR